MGMGNDMLEAYLFEMHSLLEQLDDLVLASEQAKTFSQEAVNEIFRIMHTIKGSSAMMEFGSLMTIAHRIEDLFYVVREKTMDAIPESLRPELFDLIFNSIDFFRAEIEKIENNEPLSTSIDSFLDKINSFNNKISGEGGEAAEAEAPEGGDAAPAADGAASAYGSPDFPYGIHVFFDEGVGMENLRAMMMVNAVKDFVDESQFDFYPPDVQMNPDTANFIIDNGFFLRFKTEEDRSSALPAVRDNGNVQNYQSFDYSAPASAEPELELEPAPAAPAAAQAPTAAAQAPTTAAPAQSAPAAPAAAQAPAATAGKQAHAKESLISVNLSKLDALMAVVSEIVITEAQVTASPDLKGLKLDNFTKAARQLRSLTDNLQDVAMSLRMVPVSGTFQKMKRIVRDMSKKLNRETNLVLEGEDTEVDKTIVDSISDPVMHIVRNSMDHGIEERKEDRIAAGKDPVGKIILAARQTGSEVIIEIIDDGRGVDGEKVLAKAIRQGLAQPGVDYSHKEILNFLLMPGFSTNTEVTEYSGRGVGMDVVKSNVENVGGTVSISSELGKGMTTTLKIPLTMAILDGMEVAVGRSIFTIPISNIRQIFKASDMHIIQDATHGEMIKIVDNFYSIVRAKDFYRIADGVDSFDHGVLLWVESGDNSFCLFVDELIGEQQVVVKPLPDYVNNYGIKNYGISGCTILGDGSISLILDVANIYSAQN
ncbi:MAG: chemotaxis protein CheA [Oscillospiraceae bacterium]|nr:chemotaxis protein CheA [Oscillospiraceae bacterium]